MRGRGDPGAGSWKTREAARIIALKETKELDAVQAVLRLEASGLEVPKLLMLEAQKFLGVVDPESGAIPVGQTALSLEDVAELYRRMMG